MSLLVHLTLYFKVCILIKAKNVVIKDQGLPAHSDNNKAAVLWMIILAGVIIVNLQNFKAAAEECNWQCVQMCVLMLCIP